MDGRMKGFPDGWARAYPGDQHSNRYFPGSSIPALTQRSVS